MRHNMLHKYLSLFLFLMVVVPPPLFGCSLLMEDSPKKIEETVADKYRDLPMKLGLQDKIKHIIVLMEENRSYDHLMGWLGRGNGLNGTEFNYQNVSSSSTLGQQQQQQQPGKKKIFATKNAPYVNYCDPNHGTPATAFKLFGPEYKNFNRTSTIPKMDGFAMYEWEFDEGPERDTDKYHYCGVLDMFNTSEKLPVLTSLANEFAFFDRLFAAIPGPTWPNRQFFLAATSEGNTETFPWYKNIPGQLYPSKTIFDQVAEAGAEWKFYYVDSVWELFFESVAHNPEHLHDFDQFLEDCRTGDLPSFAFMNPRGGINLTTMEGSNDDHPDHDVALAERFYKRVYEAIRASPAWNETLFVLTFDEHGGFYDHVPPPSEDVPPPTQDQESYPDSWFKFDRLGVRVPTILVSPWIKRGTIISEPPATQKPTPSSEYDLTSIIATARKLLKPLNSTGPLTRRDAWVATWEHVFQDEVSGLTQPRTDCPMYLPEAPTPTLPPHEEAAQPVNELQRFIMDVHKELGGSGSSMRSGGTEEVAQTQGEVGEIVKRHFDSHKDNTKKWKLSKKRRMVNSRKEEKLGGREDPLRFDVVLKPTDFDLRPPKFYPAHFHLSQSSTEKDKMTLWAEVPKSSIGTIGSKTTSTPTTVGGVRDHSSYYSYCLDGNGMKKGSPITMSYCYGANNSPEATSNKDRDQWWTYYSDFTIRPYNHSKLCITNGYYYSADNNTTTSFEGQQQPVKRGEGSLPPPYHNESLWLDDCVSSSSISEEDEKGRATQPQQITQRYQLKPGESVQFGDWTLNWVLEEYGHKMMISQRENNNQKIDRE